MGFLSLFGCKKEKPATQNFDTWLETTFKGQLIRTGNQVDLDPRRLFDKKIISILADHQDSVVQLVVSRNDALPNFGVDTSDVMQQWQNRKSETAIARKYLDQLPLSSLPPVSLGYIETSLYLLLYQKPIKENRKKTTLVILDWLEKLNTHPDQIFIEFVDPQMTGKETGNIIPYGFWQDGGNAHAKHTLATLSFQYSSLRELKNEIWKNWQLNTDANAMSDYMESVRNAVEKFNKDKNLNFTLKLNEAIELSDNPDNGMSFHFSVPCYKINQEDPAGEITGFYDYDSNSITGLKMLFSE